MALDAEPQSRCSSNRGCLGMRLECWASCVSTNYPKSMQSNRRKCQAMRSLLLLLRLVGLAMVADHESADPCGCDHEEVAATAFP